jgi:hypothetical protein
MNPAAILMNVVPVAGVREWIAPGLKASYGRAPEATQQAAIARAVAANGAFPAVNTPQWDAMNERRAALIRKDLAEGLTAVEQKELDRLQRMSLAAAVKAFPRPALDIEELVRLRQELQTTSSPVTE